LSATVRHFAPLTLVRFIGDIAPLRITTPDFAPATEGAKKG
jgi:hypothetical protein